MNGIFGNVLTFGFHHDHLNNSSCRSGVCAIVFALSQVRME